MVVLRIEKDDWKTYSESAFTAVFGKLKSSDTERIDYAFLVIEEDKPLVYVTVIELDSETAYWQFGGIFPWGQGKKWGLELLRTLLFEQAKYTKRVGFRVENTNYPMLKLALNERFQIIGSRFYNGSVLVEFIKELGA